MTSIETSRYLFAFVFFGILLVLLIPKLRAKPTRLIKDSAAKIGMRTFLLQNPNIAKDLRAKPTLITDPEYLAGHPTLKAFLAKYPRAGEGVPKSRGVAAN